MKKLFLIVIATGFMIGSAQAQTAPAAPVAPVAKVAPKKPKKMAAPKAAAPKPTAPDAATAPPAKAAAAPKAAAPAAKAAAKPKMAAKLDCAKAQAQAEMNQCAGEAFQKENAALNAVMVKVKAKAEAKDTEMNPGKHDYRDALMAAEKSWLTYRELQCSWNSFEGHGVAIEGQLMQDCKTRFTKARMTYFQDWLKKK